MSMWNDPYIRFSLSDDGQANRRGTMSGSPDIIPFGTKPAGDPGQFITDAEWKQDRGTSTTSGTINYIYVRGFNNSARAMQDLQVHLYYSPASLLLWPWKPQPDGKEGWARRPLRTGDKRDSQFLDVAGKNRFVTGKAFEWTVEPIREDHYCLVARLSWEGHDNEIPEDLHTINGFAAYVQKHPDIGWRNVNTLSPQFPTWNDSIEYAQGDADQVVLFTAFVYNGSLGDVVSMYSSVSGPQPALQKTEVIAHEDKEQINLWTTIPAQWASNINLTYEAKASKKIPPNLKVELKSAVELNESNRHIIPYGFTPEELDIHVDAAQLVPFGAVHYSTKVQEP